MRARKFMIFVFFCLRGDIFLKKSCFLARPPFFYARSTFFSPLFGYKFSLTPAAQVAAGLILQFVWKNYVRKQTYTSTTESESTSPDRAPRRLTSEVGGNPAHSTRYDRQRAHWLRQNRCYIAAGRLAGHLAGCLAGAAAIKS